MPEVIYLHRAHVVEPEAPRFESFDGDAFHNPIAAHAASEFDEDRPGGEGGSIAVWLVGSVCLIAAAAAAVHLAAWAGWIG